MLDRLSNKSISVAPMLDRTDRHCRTFLRLISPNVRLYTEMVVDGSIIHGDRERFLRFDPSEHPVALQLGGCDPDKLAGCAGLAEESGYDEVNLNIGCPSDRVKQAQFGACLMAEPALVASCVAAMIKNCSIPVTVKTRIGIDNMDSYEHLKSFINTVSLSGCEHFIVHARKAWLNGLSPKENRDIPPLRYDVVYRLKTDFPDLKFTINGGINSVKEIAAHLDHVDGVMIGRAVYHDPWLLKAVDNYFESNLSSESSYGTPVRSRSAKFTLTEPKSTQSRFDVVNAYLPYIEQQLEKGVYLRHMTRHMLGLFHGQPGAKGWRRFLSENRPKKHAGVEVVQQALTYVQDNRFNFSDSDEGQAGNIRQVA